VIGVIVSGLFQGTGIRPETAGYCSPSEGHKSRPTGRDRVVVPLLTITLGKPYPPRGAWMLDGPSSVAAVRRLIGSNVCCRFCKISRPRVRLSIGEGLGYRRKRVRYSVRVPTIDVVFRCQVLGRYLAGKSRCWAGQSPVAIKGGKSYKGWGGSYALVKVLDRVMVWGDLVLALSAKAFGWQGRVGWQVLRGAAISSGDQGGRVLQVVGR
jgi:hypothetical protein